MAIHDDQLDGGLFEAFHTPEEESVLQAIQRLHGAGSSVLLREAEEGTSPVLLRSERDQVADDARYRILGEIARGGIGVVYKALDEDLNRDIALKVLRPELAEREDVIQRFVEEAQVGGQLQHPGIVPIYGLGVQADGRPSFAMKLIKGRTLAELLDEEAKDVDLLAVFEQVAQTVAYAHSRGVIHRDLKPANVMVGAFGEVQVVDWGFAKVLGQDEVEAAPKEEHTVVTTVRTGGEGSQSMAGSVMGTPAYMPPEQALGRIEQLDARSDVFALGAILCEILTGKPPYTGEQEDQLIAAMQSRLEPAYERLENADAPAELVRIARHCLQPAAGERPRDAGVLSERLAQHFGKVEERARQAQLDAVAAESQTAQERYKRRRALVLAAAALIAIAAGGGGYLWWQNDLAQREAEVAPRIAGALRRATGHEGERDWGAAVTAAREAVDLAASAGLDDGGAAGMLVRFQDEQRRTEEAAVLLAADQALLSELEDIRTKRGAEFNNPEADAAFVATIEARWPGFAIDTARLSDSPHALALAAVFDAWARMRRDGEEMEGSDWRTIDGIARAIDPEHENVRDALVAEEPDALLELAGSEEVFDLPPALQATIGETLRVRWGSDEGTALLQRARRRHPDDPWIHYQLGATAEMNEDFGRAVQRYTSALALRPGSQELRHRLGMALHASGETERSLAMFRRAMVREPDWGHGHYHIAVLLAQLGREAEAEVKFHQAIEGDAENHMVYAELAKLVGKYGGREQEEIELYRRVTEMIDQEPNAYLHLGTAYGSANDPESAIQAYLDCLARNPTTHVAARAHGGMAKELWKVGRHEDALESIAFVRKNAGEDAYLWADIGNFLESKKDLGGALEAYDRSLAADPELGFVWSHRGYVLLQRGGGEGADYQEALRSYERARELGEDSFLTNARHGSLLSDVLQRYEEAMRCFERAHELDSSRWEPCQSMGLTYSRMGRLEESLRWYDEAIERASATDSNQGSQRGALLPTLLERARVHYRLQRFEDALADLDRVLVGDPDVWNAHNLRGSIFLQTGRPAEAIEPFRRAIAGNPHFVDLHVNLGVALANSGDPEAGRRKFLEALEMDGDHSLARLNLAYVSIQLGRLGDALAAYARARELDAEMAAQWPDLVSLRRKDEKRRAVLAGEEEAESAGEACDLAELALRAHADAAGALRLYERAFEERASFVKTRHGYLAACAATLSGPEHHGQALEWLRANLAAGEKRLTKAPQETAEALAFWQQDERLAAIRDVAGLSLELQQFWKDVEALRQRAEAMR